MKISGLPEQFWVVTEPSPFSATEDILFPCTFGRLMLRVRGGLQEDEIIGIYADEGEARQTAARLLGKYPVRPLDALALEVTVHVMVIPKSEEMTARELVQAALEAVRNAIRLAEKQGHQHRLVDQVSLGISEMVELRNQTVIPGSQAVSP